MLSSTLVSVLAPHRNGRQRRSKRGGEPGQEAQGYAQEVLDREGAGSHYATAAAGLQTMNQFARESQNRAQSLGNRRGTLGWLPERTPASEHLDTTAPPVPSHSLGMHDHSRMSNVGCHGGQLSLTGSKPTTSTLLLSLRGLNANNNPTHSRDNSFSEPSSTNDSPFELYKPNVSINSTNGSPSKRSKSLLFLTPTPYRAIKTSRPHISQSSSNTTEENPSAHFSTGQKEIPPISNSRMTRTYPTPSIPNKQTSLTSNVTNKLSITQKPNINNTTDSSRQPPRFGPEKPGGLKSQSLSRASTLESPPRRRLVSQEDGSPLGFSDATGGSANINKNTPSGGLNNNDLAFRSAYDNTWSSPNGKDNNNPVTRPAYPSNLNSAGLSANPLRRANAQDIPELDSMGTVLKTFNLNNLNSHKAHSLPGMSSRSPVSPAVGMATLRGPRDILESDLSDGGMKGHRLHSPLSRLGSLASLAADHSTGLRAGHPTLEGPCSPGSGNNTPVSSQGFRFTLGTGNINKDHKTKVACRTPAQGYLVSPNTNYLAPSSTFVTSCCPLTPPATPKLDASTSPASPARPNASLSPSSETTSPLTPSTPTVSILKVKSYSTAAHPVSSPLTPPFTPTQTSPAHTASSTTGERTFTGALDASPTNQAVKQRVTWQDSVEVQHSESTSRGQRPESSPRSPSSPSLSRSLRSVGGPSTFSSLRSSSPTWGLSPHSPLGSRVSSLQVWRDKQCQLSRLSANSADQAAKRGGGSGVGRTSYFTFDSAAVEAPVSGLKRKVSEEEPTDQSSATLSLPPDFGSGYKLRYSSPPYSALKSSRPPPEKAKDALPASTCISPSTLTRTCSFASLTCRLSPSPTTSRKSPSFPIYSRAGLSESSKVIAMEMESAQRSYCSKQSSQHGRGVHTSLSGTTENDRSLPLQVDTTAGSPVECVDVVETLVYRVSKADSSATLDCIRAATSASGPRTSTPQVSVENKYNSRNRQPGLSHDLSLAPRHDEVIGKFTCRSYKSSDGSELVGKQGVPSAYAGTESQGSRMKGSGLNGVAACLPEGTASDTASRQSTASKRGLFAMKGKKENATGTPSGFTEHPGSPPAEKAKADTERALRGGNKIELVLNKLRQTFNVKCLDDESLSLWRRKRRSQTPSTSGSSNVSNSTAGSGDTMEGERKKDGGAGEKEGDNRLERDIRKESRYVLNCSPSFKDNPASSANSSIRTGRDEKSNDKQFKVSLSADTPVTKGQTQCLTADRSPAHHSSLDLYKDSKADLKLRSPPLGRASSPHRLQPWSNAGPLPPLEKTPTGGLRSPLSPFPSLSPFEGSDIDCVFYSPDPEAGSAGPARSRASTGPESAGWREGRLASYSSCADLKYGLEAGRSCSVSSVHRSRPSGPGRISTGPRVASVEDLDNPALTWGEVTAAPGDSEGRGDWTVPSRQYHTLPGRRRKTTRGREGLNQWSFVADRTVGKGGWGIDSHSAAMDYGPAVVPGDPSRLRSRSLPRSLIRPLSAWSSPTTANSTPSNTSSGRLRSPASLDSPHFQWDVEVPLTPPSSPCTRKMSKPPSSSSSSMSPVSPPTPDNLTSRVRLRSRGYISSLEAFDEYGSDSDTTTDDEYYLETEAAGDDRETEL